MAEAAAASRADGADERRSLVSAILLGVVGPEVFIVQPGFVQGMVQYLGFDDRAAGHVASAEMFGIAATTVAMTFAAHRFNWRRVVAWSLAIMVVANVACTLVRDVKAFAALRFAAGVGAGGLISLSFAAIGLTRRPDRNFGYLIMWVLTYGAFALLAMPTAYRVAGFAGVLWFFALFPLITLPWLRYFPVSGENTVQVEKDAVDLPGSAKGLALAAMFAYFLAQGVVWAYLFLIGIAGGLTEQQVANGLTVSQFAGIAGALGAVRDRRSLWTRRAAHHRHRRRRRDALLSRRPVQRDHVPGRGQHLQSRLELHPPIPARRDGELRSARPRRRLRGRDADARARRGPASRRASSGRAST